MTQGEPRVEKRRRRSMSLLGMLVGLIGLVSAPAAVAAEPEVGAIDVVSLSIILPAEATEVWASVENGGADAASLTVALVEGTSSPRAILTRATSFGAGAVLPASAGRLTVFVASSTRVEPDISLTAVDAHGVILDVVSARVVLAANAETDPARLAGVATIITPAPSPSPIAAPGGVVTPAGGLAWSGADVSLLLGLAAIAIIVVGGGITLVIVRRRRAAQTGADA